MSTSIDRRVVQMNFENEDFQKKAKDTTSTLQKLEEALNIDKGNNISKSLDTISSKFTQMGIIGQNVMRNLTDDAYNMAKSFVKSLTIDNVGQGFEEYELKMGSIQTIMNATGESLETVGAYLDDLNHYADRTIYSFSDMTSNIAKFTNAGVNLDMAVKAIQGVSNVAALSGASTENATHAMYNFAQALSSGSVRLIDWKSIENANMATVEFKEQLIETAVELGTLTKQGDKYVSTTTNMQGKTSDAFNATAMFNDNLQYQWMTTDVLTRTLAKYVDETTELGQKAFKAATELKTFNQMIDTIKESVGSGWAMSFEIIFGNFYEAIDLWTEINNRVTGWLDSVSNRRNTILQAWKDAGGRDALIQSLWNIFDAVEMIIKPIKEAFNLVFYGVESLEELKEGLDPVAGTLVRLSERFQLFTASLKPSEATMEMIKNVFHVFFSVLKAVINVVSKAFTVIQKIVSAFSPLLKIVQAVISGISGVHAAFIDAANESETFSKGVKKISAIFIKLRKVINDFSDGAVEKINEFFASFDANEFAKNAVANFDTFWKKIYNAFQIGKQVFNDTGSIIEAFKAAISSIFNVDNFSDIGDKIKNFFKDLFSGVSNDISKGASRTANPFVVFFETIRNYLSQNPILNRLGQGFVNVANIIKDTVMSIGGSLGSFGQNIFNFFKDLKLSDIVSIASIAKFILVGTVVTDAVSKFTKPFKILSKELPDILEGVQKTVKNFAKGIRDVSRGISFQLQSEALKNVAMAVGILVLAVIALADVPEDALDRATAVVLAMGTLLAGLMVAVGVMTKHENVMATNPAKTLYNLSVAVEMFAVLGTLAAVVTTVAGAVAIFSTIKDDALRKGLNAMWEITGIIGSLAFVLLVLSTGVSNLKMGPQVVTSIAALASAMIPFAIGLAALVVPIAILGAMDPDKMTQGLIGLGVVLAELLVFFTILALSTKLMKKASRTIISITKSLFMLGLGILALTAPIAILGAMDTNQLNKGMSALRDILLTLSVAMIGFAVSSKIMGSSTSGLLKISIAVGLLAASFAVLGFVAPVIIANAPIIVKAIGVLVRSVCQVLVESADAIAEAALLLIVEVLDSLVTYFPEIWIKAEELIIMIVDGVLDLMQRIGQMIGEKFSSEDFFESFKIFSYMAGYIAILEILGANIKKAIPVVLLIGVLFAMLASTFIILSRADVNGVDMIFQATAMSIVITSLFPLIFALAAFDKIAEGGKNSWNKTAQLIASLTVILAAVAGTFGLLKAMKVNSGEMIKQAQAISLVLLAISPLVVAIAGALRLSGQLKPGSWRTFGILMLSLTGIIALSVGALLAMDKLGINPNIAIKNALAMDIIMGGISAVMLSLASALALLAKVRVDPATLASTGFIFEALFAALIVIVGGIAYLIGYLEEVTGGKVSQYLEAAVPVFIMIGEALGGLVGGLIGGVVEGTLVAVGKGLADFSENAQPFFDLISSMDTDFMEKVGYLTDGITKLATAGFINAVADLLTFFSGESSLGLLAKDLAEMAPNLNAFYEACGEIDLSKSEAVKNVSEAILSLMLAIPREGGVIGALTGTAMIEEFSESLKPMAEGIVEFSKAGKDIDEESVQIAANAGKVISELCDSLPKVGGVVQAWGGTTDIKGFANSLKPLGQGIKDFNDVVTDTNGSVINTESVQIAVDAGKMITGLVDNIPSTGGWMQKLTGEKDIQGFAEKLPILASGIKNFAQIAYDNREVISSESVDRAGYIGLMVSAIANSLPGSGGFIQSFAGRSDLGDFSANLRQFGVGIRGFANMVDGVSYTGVPLALEAAQNIVDLEVGLSDAVTGTGLWGWFQSVPDLTDFANHIPALGTGIKGLSDNVEGANLENIRVASDAINALVDVIALSQHLGEFSLNAFNDAISSLDYTALELTVSDVVTNENIRNVGQVFFNIGKGFLTSLFSGMNIDNEENKRLYKTISGKLIQKILEPLTIDVWDLSNPFTVAGTYMVEGLIYGLGDHNINGMTRLAKAAKDLASAVINNIEKEAQIASPSKRLKKDGRYMVEGLANGLRENVSMVTSASDFVSKETFDAMSNSLNSIYGILGDGEDITPVISPVVDLTNVRLASNEMNGLLSSDPYYTVPEFAYTRKVVSNINFPEATTPDPIDLTKITNSLDRLNQKMEDIELKMGQSQVVLDTGAVVGQLTNPMIVSINRANRYASRQMTQVRLAKT